MRNQHEATNTAGRAEVVVRDPQMRVVHDQANRAACSSLSVLLLGETGVGKEIVARTIHTRSRRATGPFLAVNCAAIAESLLEAELFGAERGAYTGAVAGRAGLFEAADGGTLFLDEVGEMPVAIQCKLLRVLEERSVLRVGSTRARPVDLRVVAATNRDIVARHRRRPFPRRPVFSACGDHPDDTVATGAADGDRTSRRTIRLRGSRRSPTGCIRAPLRRGACPDP